MYCVLLQTGPPMGRRNCQDKRARIGLKKKIVKVICCKLFFNRFKTKSSIIQFFFVRERDPNILVPRLYLALSGPARTYTTHFNFSTENLKNFLTKRLVKFSRKLKLVNKWLVMEPSKHLSKNPSFSTSRKRLSFQFSQKSTYNSHTYHRALKFNYLTTLWRTLHGQMQVRNCGGHIQAAFKRFFWPESLINSMAIRS